MNVADEVNKLRLVQNSKHLGDLSDEDAAVIVAGTQVQSSVDLFRLSKTLDSVQNSRRTAREGQCVWMAVVDIEGYQTVRAACGRL